MATLTGRVALITGGARGIGRGIAGALADAGADIAIAEVDQVRSAAQQYGEARISGYATAQNTAREFVQRGRRAIAIEADVTQRADTLRMIDATLRDLGRLDILVCNAGVVSISTVD